MGEECLMVGPPSGAHRLPLRDHCNLVELH